MTDPAPPPRRTPASLLAEWRVLEARLTDVVEEPADCERLQRRIDALRNAYEAARHPGGPATTRPVAHSRVRTERA